MLLKPSAAHRSSSQAAEVHSRKMTTGRPGCRRVPLWPRQHVAGNETAAKGMWAGQRFWVTQVLQVQGRYERGRTNQGLPLVVDVVEAVDGRQVRQPRELLDGGGQGDGLRDEAQGPGVEDEELDGVGEGEANDSGATGLLGHGEKADRGEHDSAVEVAVEGDPQVEGVSSEECAVVLVRLACELLHTGAHADQRMGSVRELPS